jgi:hypothetical protein
MKRKCGEFLTGKRAFKKSKSTFGASAILVAHEINIMREPAAKDKVEVSQG